MRCPVYRGGLPNTLHCRMCTLQGIICDLHLTQPKKKKQRRSAPPKKRKLWRRLTLLTLNIQGLTSAKEGVGSIQGVLHSPPIADVVAIQEDTSSRHAPLSREHRQVARCQAEPLRGAYLLNTLWVHRDLETGARALPSLQMQQNCPVPRCASVIRLADGLRIANVHLCGGRFDDRKFRELVDVKRRQMKQLLGQGLRTPCHPVLDEVRPDVVMGDFIKGLVDNGPLNQRRALGGGSTGESAIT